MSKRKIADTAADPTLPRTPVIIGGVSYDLCFDLGALAEAETLINAELMGAGRKDTVNLLFALPVLNLANLRVIFAAALRKFHPEIPYDAAVRMVEPGNMILLAEKISDAWKEATPEAPAEANPPQAAG